MSPWRLFQLAMRSVLRNKVRSMLTVLGVVIGVASVVVMVGVGVGAQSEVAASIENLGTNLVVITPGSSSRGGVSGGSGTYNRLTLEDAELLGRDAQYLSAVSPVVFSRTTLVVGGNNWRTNIRGVDVGYQTIRDWDVVSGRFFDPEEVRARRKVVLLGQTVVDNLFEGEDPVGQTMRVRDVPCEIIGVLARKGQTAEGTDQDDVLLAPYTTVQTRLAGWQYVAQILASAWSDAELEDAVSEARLLLREAHGLGEREPDDFEVKDQRELAEAAQSTTAVMTVLLSAIASISLLVGGIGIMNIMLVSVSERTREIGIRRAVGARRSDVLAQFLVESIVLGLLGGLLGSLLGLAGAAALGQATGWAVRVPSWALGVSIGFSLAVGVFFGWYPARRAARMDPIEALRHQ